jgi:N-dimethylarginine dimethylaminohydrolase
LLCAGKLRELRLLAGSILESNGMHDIDAIPGEKWFPDPAPFAADLPRHWGDWGVASEVDDLKAVLMRRPGREVDDFDHRQARFLAPVDAEKMRVEHDRLTELYRRHGVAVHYIEKQRTDRPNALFCRDLVFMTPEGAILARPAMQVRRGEERYAAQALAALGVPIIKTVNGSGTFEGAMGMWVDRQTVILATGVRTNRSGYDQVAGELSRLGVTRIIPMPIPYGHAHIDGLLNFAARDVVMIHAPQVPYDVVDALKQEGFQILEAPSQTEAKQNLAINFVALKPGLVVQPAGNPRTRAVLEAAGIEVIPLDIPEILKGAGAIHCMTAFLKRG